MRFWLIFQNNILLFRNRFNSVLYFSLMTTFIIIICITDYAMERAKIKGWITKDDLPQTRKEVRTAMSQKIGELK